MTQDQLAATAPGAGKAKDGARPRRALMSLPRRPSAARTLWARERAGLARIAGTAAEDGAEQRGSWDMLRLEERQVGAPRRDLTAEASSFTPFASLPRTS